MRLRQGSAEQPQYHYRTFPTRLSNVRGDGTNLWDLSVIKNTKINDRMRHNSVASS